MTEVYNNKVVEHSTARRFVFLRTNPFHVGCLAIPFCQVPRHVTFKYLITEEAPKIFNLFNIVTISIDYM